MFLPTVSPSFPPEPDASIPSGSPSGSGVGVSLVGRETADAGAEWSEEQDRELAARAFVNAAADIALSMSLGALCVRAKCAACGINFLAMTKADSLCHCCVSER